MRFIPNLTNNIISNITASDASVQNALQEVSTGQRVNQASDDPAAAAANAQLQAQSAQLDQYTTNGDSVLGQAQTADSILTSVVSLLNQAVTLGVEGANGTASATNRAAISSSVQGLLTNVVGLANTTYQGVPLFGGTNTSSTPFTASSTSSTGYQYNGNSGINQVQIGQATTVQVNIPGSTLFDNPGSSVLGALSNLATALSSGTSAQIGTATAAVTTALNYVSQQHVVYGNTVNQINAQESYLSQDQVTITSQEQSLVGIDSATAIEDLTHAETANSAVLQASAKVLQNSLLTYLPN
jgi:flagellar hook-associated protein 3 FlgL